MCAEATPIASRRQRAVSFLDGMVVWKQSALDRLDEVLAAGRLGRALSGSRVRKTQRFGGQPRPTAKPLMKIDSNRFSLELRARSHTVGKPSSR